MHKDAHFSEDRKYRYALWRIWDESKSCAMFIGLNPSTADEEKNDPTVSRCQNWAREWDYGGLCMANIFAYRATKPRDLKRRDNPVGRATDRWIRKLADQAGIIVAVWGNHGRYRDRANEVLELLSDKTIYCLEKTGEGQPRHPLGVKKKVTPQLYNRAR